MTRFHHPSLCPVPSSPWPCRYVTFPRNPSRPSLEGPPGTPRDSGGCTSLVVVEGTLHKLSVRYHRFSRVSYIGGRQRVPLRKTFDGALRHSEPVCEGQHANARGLRSSAEGAPGAPRYNGNACKGSSTARTSSSRKGIPREVK